MYHGVINVYKEQGYTSFDVIARLRGILKQKKIGHTGTLDPDAEGVLVVCLGKATKLCELLTDKDKSYEAVLHLGISTDTEDASGTVLHEQSVCASKEEITEAIMSFVGTYPQIPPMYSAIKVNGKKLYELARKGVEIERTPRMVTIHAIEIIDIDLPLVRMRVSCGKGTYIRSLCRDIGDQLGCGGMMEHLVRNEVNAASTGKIFTIEESLSLSEIEALVENDSLASSIIPVDALFPKLPKRYVTMEGEKKLRNGNLLYEKDFGEPYQGNQTKCLVYDINGEFTALYEYRKDLHAWKADKMFL